MMRLDKFLAERNALTVERRRWWAAGRPAVAGLDDCGRRARTCGAALAWRRARREASALRHGSSGGGGKPPGALRLRGATDMQAVERRRRICAGLAWRWRAGAARAGLGPCPKGRKYITGIIGRPPFGCFSARRSGRTIIASYVKGISKHAP